MLVGCNKVNTLQKPNCNMLLKTRLNAPDLYAIAENVITSVYIAVNFVKM